MTHVHTHTKTTGTYPQGVTADAFGFDTDSFSEFTQFSHQNVYSHSLLSAKRRDVQFDGIKIKCFHTRKLTWKQCGLAEDKSLSHTHTYTHTHTHTHTQGSILSVVMWTYNQVLWLISDFAVHFVDIFRFFWRTKESLHQWVHRVRNIL